MSSGFDLTQIFSNPLILLLYLPFLPFIIISSFASPVGETKNLEEWTVGEDPETGEIHIVVHRNVRRG